MTAGEITTDIPARIDRLPWSRFHLLVVVALGVTWILDGLQITIFGSIGPILKDRHTLGLTDQEIGDIAACYVGGAVSGALLFGWLTDRFGRRLIFNLTLAIYTMAYCSQPSPGISGVLRRSTPSPASASAASMRRSTPPSTN